VASVIRDLEQRMSRHSDAMEFELAQRVKDRIELLERFHSKSVVVNPQVADVDVFGLARDTTSAHVNYMRVIDGAVVQGISIEMKPRLEGDRTLNCCSSPSPNCASASRATLPEVVVPVDPGVEVPGVRFIVPQRGDMKHLLELSEQNARFHLMDRQRQEKLVDPEAHTNRILEQLQKDLRLSELPRHIECFDNSNTQGTDPVSACVVFKDGKPSKKDYRHFNIRTVEGT
jgi:excinuclease ABC subunit C